LPTKKKWWKETDSVSSEHVSFFCFNRIEKWN
jgi:hypothetical protein